ncbi:MAG: FtsQ-type POTRA domain-containing protein [Chitinispirillaceae bacterium]|nr:FtsQ-type POTRA domain-containing protein [Chitinispirillaceae bacterium]
MAKKRVGANRRRNSVSRKKKIGSDIKKGSRSFFIMILVIIAGGALVYGGKKGYVHLKKYIDNTDAFSVNSIVIEGAMLSAKDSIQAWCGLNTGMKLYEVAEKKINEAVKRDVWIDNIELKKRINGLVYLKINERKPIAVVNIGEILLVDKNGVLLPFKSHMALDMPVVTGLKDSVGEHKKKILRKAHLARLLTFISQTSKLEDFNSVVSQVDFSRKDRIRLACRSSRIVMETVLEHTRSAFEKLRYLENSLSGEDGKPAHVNMMYEDIAFVIQEEPVKDVVLRSVND